MRRFYLECCLQFARIVWMASLFLFVDSGLHAEATHINEATVLYFEEAEPGIEPYRVRYIITDSFMRIDEESSQDAYLLFDRKNKKISSVAGNNQTVLELAVVNRELPAEIKALEDSLNIIEKKRTDLQLPMIGSHSVESYTLGTELNNCIEYSVSRSLLPHVVPVLREYHGVLAENSRQNLQNQPKEFLTDCLLINDGFAAEKYLSHGFPVMIVKPGEFRRFLINYRENETVEDALFDVPTGYRVIQPGSH